MASLNRILPYTLSLYLIAAAIGGAAYASTPNPIAKPAAKCQAKPAERREDLVHTILEVERQLGISDKNKTDSFIKRYDSSSGRIEERVKKAYELKLPVNYALSEAVIEELGIRSSEEEDIGSLTECFSNSSYDCNTMTSLLIGYAQKLKIALRPTLLMYTDKDSKKMLHPMAAYGEGKNTLYFDSTTTSWLSLDDIKAMVGDSYRLIELSESQLLSLQFIEGINTAARLHGKEATQSRINCIWQIYQNSFTGFDSMLSVWNSKN